MQTLTKEQVEKFCGLCAFSKRAWTLMTVLFSDNPDSSFFHLTHYRRPLEFLYRSLHESAVLTLVGLHDRADASQGRNLTIDFVLRYGNWNATTKAELDALRKELDGFADLLRPARNKIIAHTDVEVLMDGKKLAIFDRGDEVRYFELLQNFVNLIRSGMFETAFSLDDQDFLKEAGLLVELFRKDIKDQLDLNS